MSGKPGGWKRDSTLTAVSIPLQLAPKEEYHGATDRSPLIRAIRTDERSYSEGPCGELPGGSLPRSRAKTRGTGYSGHGGARRGLPRLWDRQIPGAELEFLWWAYRIGPNCREDTKPRYILFVLTAGFGLLLLTDLSEQVVLPACSFLRLRK